MSRGKHLYAIDPVDQVAPVAAHFQDLQHLKVVASDSQDRAYPDIVYFTFGDYVDRPDFPQFQDIVKVSGAHLQASVMNALLN